MNWNGNVKYECEKYDNEVKMKFGKDENKELKRKMKFTVLFVLFLPWPAIIMQWTSSLYIAESILYIGPSYFAIIIVYIAVAEIIWMKPFPN